MPRARSPSATRSDGLSCSSHVITLVPVPNGPSRTCSSVRSSSNLGVTTKGVPFAGMITAVSRSLLPQVIPVKYTIDVPPVSSSASILRSIMIRLAFSMRALRSSTEIATTPSFIGESAAMAGGRLAADVGVVAAVDVLSGPAFVQAAPAAANEPVATNVRREIMVGADLVGVSDVDRPIRANVAVCSPVVDLRPATPSKTAGGDSEPPPAVELPRGDPTDRSGRTRAVGRRQYCCRPRRSFDCPRPGSPRSPD